MRKSFFTFVLLFTISTISQAQIIEEVGVSAGISKSRLSWFYETESSYFNHRMNSLTLFNANAFVEFKGWKYFNFRGLMGYVEKGSTSRIVLHDSSSPENNYLGKIEAINRFNYVTIGIGGKIKIPWRKWELYGTATPRIDYMISSTQSDLILGDVGRDIQNINLGMRFGWGVKYDVSDQFALHFSVEQNLNFTRINDTEYQPGSFGLSIDDDTKYINLGLSYALGNRTNS